MKNEIDKKFGKLTVIAEGGRIGGQVLWVCKCDCGKEKTIRGASLRRGETQSCGCLAQGNHRLPYGESSKRLLFRSYQNCAKKRGYVWGLNESEFFTLTQKPCVYCGILPTQIYRASRESYGHFTYNGIDRVDNSKGYCPDNVVACCTICNVAKSNMSLDEFISWIRRVYAIVA